MLKRPKIREIAENLSNGSDTQGEHHLEQEQKKGLKKYIIRYMKCVKVLLADHKDQRIANLVNQQDVEGNTPLHYAVTNWPRNIAMELLKFGADMCIRNKKDKMPIRHISKDDIEGLLDEHCMKSLGFDVFDGPQLDTDADEEDDHESFKEMMDGYEPRFMTNINQSPVKFDFGMLVPRKCSSQGIRNKEDGFEENLENERIFKGNNEQEMLVLSELSYSKAHRDLVTHPVIKMFVWMKWNKVSRYYHRVLRMEFLLMYVMTWYIFNQFGGVTFENTPFEPVKVSNISNDQEFCTYHVEKFKIINEHHTYGKLEQLNISQRLQYYFAAFHGDLEINETTESNITLYKSKSTDGHLHPLHHHYLHFSYVAFLPIAAILIYWLIMDAKQLLGAPNHRDGRTKEGKTFMGTVIPLGGDLVNLLLIVVIIAFSDGVLWFVIGYIFINILFREVVQIIVSPQNYFTKLTNWGDMLVLALICLVVYVPNKYIKDPMYFTLTPDDVNLMCNSTSNEPWKDTKIGLDFDVSVKRYLSGFLIVLLWTRFTFDVARDPGKKTEMFNKYSLMYQRVASSFLKLLIIYACFIISFSLGFYVMFHNDVGNQRLTMNGNSLTSYVFFDTPFQSFIKSMAMFIGEVDFNNIPIGVPYARRDGDMSVTLGYAFYLLFIFMVVMVLMNLLNGLAVTDITEIIKESEILHQISMIDILYDFEEMSLRNKEGLERVSRIFPFIQPVLLRLLDISKELLLFESGNKTEIFQEESSYPKPDLPNRNLNLPLGLGRFGKKGAFGYVGNERILSKAKIILLNNNKSKIEERKMQISKYN